MDYKIRRDTPNAGYISRPIFIGENAFIGGCSIILKGVTIGENSVVGAFSFVTQSLPDNVMAVGIPAKVIKSLKEDNDNRPC